MKTVKETVPNSKLKHEFEKVALSYLPDMYRLALSFTRNKENAEDLVQKSVLKAYRAFHTFQPGTNIKAWLFKILRNAFISDYRRMKKHAEQSIDEENEDFSFYVAAKGEAEKALETLPEKILENPSRLEYVLGDEVKLAMDSLSNEFREVIFLCDIEGMAYQDIAKVLAIPVGTVRSRLARARSVLQKHLWQYAHKRGLLKTFKR